MKIGLVSPYDFPYPGGVTKHILNLSRVFRQRGYQTRIVTASSQKNGSLPPGVIRVTGSVLPIRYNGSVARICVSPLLVKRVRQLLEQERFDVLHIHEPITPALPWVVIRQAQHLSPRTALIGTFHSFREDGDPVGSVPWLRRFVSPAIGGVVMGLDGRIAVSSVSRDYANQASPGQYRIIPNGVDAATFGAPSVEPLPGFDRGPNILFVGRLEPRKGFSYLLDAFVQVKTRIPEAQLLVVGPQPPADRRPFERKVGRLGLTGVHFLGYVPDQELARYYSSCQVFCAPSVGFESFGMVLLEAMAAGTAIVAADIDGYRSLMKHEQEGLLVPPRDVPALSDALIRLLLDSDLRDGLGRQGKTTASAYGWERVADQVLDYYNDVLEKKWGTAAPGVTAGEGRGEPFAEKSRLAYGDKQS